ARFDPLAGVHEDQPAGGQEPVVGRAFDGALQEVMLAAAGDPEEQLPHAGGVAEQAKLGVDVVVAVPAGRAGDPPNVGGLVVHVQRVPDAGTDAELDDVDGGVGDGLGVGPLEDAHGGAAQVVQVGVNGVSQGADLAGAIGRVGGA